MNCMEDGGSRTPEMLSPWGGDLREDLRISIIFSIIFVRFSLELSLIYRGGDKVTEYEDLYRLYFKDVFLYIKSLANDEHIAEDITSETFLKAIQSIDSFKGKCDIRVWLCQIAKNCYFSYLRQHKRLVNLDTVTESANSIDIDVALITSETSIQIHEVLHHLEEPYKEVFSLRTFGELSFKQIAALFGKSDNWACVTYHRARKKISEGMEGLQ